MTYKQKISLLQKNMLKNKIDIYIVLNSDPHLSEYLAQHHQCISFMSGFKGSYGVLVFTHNNAFLWTDGRYWLQAQKELKESGVILKKQDINHTFKDWIKEYCNSKTTIGIDFKTLPLTLEKDLKKYCNLKHYDLISKIWINRPELPTYNIYEHSKKFYSLSRIDKIALVRKEMKRLNANAHFISSLDDIAWILNLRGKDIEFNPLFFSFLLIMENQILFFINPKKLNHSLKNKLQNEGIILKNYENIHEELKKLNNTTLLIDPNKTTSFFIQGLKNITIIQDLNPSTYLKSCKDKKEISCIKKAMIEDGVALCRFYSWLEENIHLGFNEFEIGEKLSKLRSMSPYYISDSFANIVGFNANGAIIHYKADEKNSSAIKGNGLLLIDSGGQYLNGTTDITRVFPIGKISAKQKKDYTLVLKALISISTTIFPKNISMPLLDSITRKPLWEHQINYNHGSGHGVGYFLSVHEGPQNLSYTTMPSLKNQTKKGMISSLEPGIYRKDKWGIRLENLAIILDIEKAKEQEFGNYLYFETLTLCPFERKCIDIKLLNSKEKKWLNNYHKEVYKKLHKKLQTKELKWLKKKTAPI
ncbi:aminopeptidase P family protein [Campylobacter sp. 2018MI35]|uniref:aminopeptidase P family protein n=1 Tax=Campylobacter sp. 2018MI34 TaxID=2800582 RepID=UPI001902CEB4|nr:aminopeptidase P family protein [Campylobacter sp. 2018MI34]MBK1992245.1 aminopeptidase P family protein [Campylobacter sp. 2018MI34]